jgi:hypothetical protein
MSGPQVKVCPVCGESFTPDRPWQKYDKDECKRKAAYQRGPGANTVTARAIAHRGTRICTGCKATKGKRTAVWWDDEDREAENFETVMILCARCAEKINRIKKGENLLFEGWDRKAEHAIMEASEAFQQDFGPDGQLSGLSVDDIGRITGVPGAEIAKAYAEECKQASRLPQFGFKLSMRIGGSYPITSEELAQWREARTKLRGYIWCPRCQRYICEITAGGGLSFASGERLTLEESVDCDAVGCPRCSKKTRTYWVALESSQIFGERVVTMTDERREYLWKRWEAAQMPDSFPTMRTNCTG